MPDGRVLVDGPPLFVDLRPMTIADMEAGEVWEPGVTLLAARRCDDAGNLLLPKNLRLKLPPELRANTFANVAEIFRRFRRVSPAMKEYVDSFALFMPKSGGPDDGRPIWEPYTLPG